MMSFFVHCFRINLEFRSVGLCGGRRTRRKTLKARTSQQQTQPTNDAFVGGKRSHHCSIPALTRPLSVWSVVAFFFVHHNHDKGFDCLPGHCGNVMFWDIKTLLMCFLCLIKIGCKYSSLITRCHYTQPIRSGSGSARVGQLYSKSAGNILTTLSMAQSKNYS